MSDLISGLVLFCAVLFLYIAWLALCLRRAEAKNRRLRSYLAEESQRVRLLCLYVNGVNARRHYLHTRHESHQ